MHSQSLLAASVNIIQQQDKETPMTSDDLQDAVTSCLGVIGNLMTAAGYTKQTALNAANATNGTDDTEVRSQLLLCADGDEDSVPCPSKAMSTNFVLKG